MDVVKKLKEDLAALEREFKHVIPKIIHEAASLGDLSENAEYEAARQRQTMVSARIAQIRKRLAALSLVNLKDIPADRAGFGSTVTIQDNDSGERKTFRLVHSEEVDVAKGMISMESPVGHALAGKKVGDEVVIRLPASSREYEVVALSTIHDTAE